MRSRFLSNLEPGVRRINYCRSVKVFKTLRWISSTCILLRPFNVVMTIKVPINKNKDSLVAVALSDLPSLKILVIEKTILSEVKRSAFFVVTSTSVSLIKRFMHASISCWKVFFIKAFLFFY